MQIGNFTPDDLKWTHQGISGILKADTVTTFDNERRGNFILNSIGKRGLVRLDWVDPEKDPDYMKNKKKESYEQYKNFWNYQIETMNSHNEQLRNERKPYVRPGKQYHEKAEELGLVLLGPKSLSAPEGKSNAQVDKELETENENLRTTVDKLMEKVEQLLALKTPHEVPDPEPEKTANIIDIEAVKKKFMYLSANQLSDWIDKNKDAIKMWPSELLTALDDKHVKIYKENLDPSILE